MPVEFCGDGEQDEEENRFFNQKLPTGRLFQSNKARGSFSKFDEAQFLRSIDSPKGQAKDDLDTALVPLTELWGDSISQHNIITVIPESPQPVRRRQGGFGDRNGSEYPEDELETFPRSTQPQNRWETQPNDNDLVVLESPLNTPCKRRRVMDRESGDEDRTASTLPEPSKIHPEALQETQYEDGSSKWWGSLSGWATPAADKHLIADGAVGKKHIETSDKQEHYSEYQASDSIDLLTVSQLLPQSLMESLPMPPPLTQWPTGGVDCDEL